MSELNYKWVNLPLYQNLPDYEYTIILDEISCIVRFYYNEYSEAWLMDIKKDGEVEYIVKGIRLVPQYPILSNYTSIELKGFFLLQPIGNGENKFTTDAYNLSRWFQLFYISGLTIS